MSSALRVIPRRTSIHFQSSSSFSPTYPPRPNHNTETCAPTTLSQMAQFSQRPYDLPLQGMQSQISLPPSPPHVNASKDNLHSQMLPSNAARGSDDSKRSKGLSLTSLLGRKNSSEKTTKTGDKPKKRGPKPDSKPAVNRRQELNRQAQRTHRERKELYTKGLENQIVELKISLKTVEAESNKYQQENRILKELLRVNGIPFIPTPATIDDLPLRNNGLFTNQTYDSNWTSPDFNGMDSTSPATTAMSVNNDSLSVAQTPTYNSPTNSSGHVNKASNSIYTSASATPIDPSTQAITMVNGHGIGNTNPAANLALVSASSTYNDSASQNHVKALGNQIGGGPNYPQRFTSYGAPGINHDQVGVEFVYALEESCKDHAAFMMKRAVDTSSTELSGHALMMTCPSRDEIMASFDNPEAHFPLKMPDMPASELNRMMMMSANMDLGGEVTPVMALKLIRADERYDLMSLTELNELKDQLKAKSRCYGFGAVLEEYEVRDVIDQIMGDRVKQLQEERSNRVVENIQLKELALQNNAQNHNANQNYNTDLNYNAASNYNSTQSYDSGQDFNTGPGFIPTQNFVATQTFDSTQNFGLAQNFGAGQNFAPGQSYECQQFNTVQQFNPGQHHHVGQNYAGAYL